MKKQLMIASAILLLGTFACKKNETPPPVQQQGIDPNATVQTNEIKQKMYDLPTEVITEAVKNFKRVNNSNTANNSVKRISFSDIQIDSSIFILEATLNYDFDKIPTGSETSQDSCSFEINCTNNSVSSTDLTVAYNYISQYINQKSSGINKVKIIDITAFLTNSKIKYVANITYFPDLAQRTDGLCDPYASGYTAYWSNYYAHTVYGCTAGNDGPTNVEFNANCTVAISGCNGFYWANVTTLNFFTTPDPLSTLFYCHCSNYCTTLSGTNLNTYVNACTSIGSANVPSSPSGMHIAGYDVIDKMALDNFNNTLLYFWWQLNVTYGTYGCGSGGGSSRPI